MRKGGGKPKGGAYELTIARKISLAMKQFGVSEDDCYRTKNSGATKSQPGDLQFSPALASIFPALVECKHYKKIEYKIGVPLHLQPKSYVIREWWEQLLREQRVATKPRFGLLVMRQNHCPDLCAFSLTRMRKIFIDLDKPWIGLYRKHFKSLIVTRYRDEEVWIVSLADFLKIYANHYKWFVLLGVLPKCIQ